MPVSQAVTYRAGQYDFFQSSAGRLVHRFHAALGWAEEDLQDVTGMGSLAPTFTSAAPAVAVVGGVVVVTVEDTAGNAWIFEQGATGNWAFTKQNATT